MTRIIIIAAILSTTLSTAAGAGEPGMEFSLRQIPESAWRAQPAASDVEWLGGGAGDAAEPLSATRAVLYSLLVPGLGDYYAGRTDRSRYFFIAEAAVWTSFAVFRIQGRQDEDAYQNFAVRFAGIASRDHSDDFYAELRVWNSSDDYEAFIKADARPENFPDVGAEALDRYYEQNRVSDFEAWEWESIERRLQFAELRSASKAAYRRSMFSIAAAGLNRAVSAIFAYQAVKSQRDDSSQARYRIEVTAPEPYDAAVSIVRTF